MNSNVNVSMKILDFQPELKEIVKARNKETLKYFFCMALMCGGFCGGLLSMERLGSLSILEDIGKQFYDVP